MRIPTLQQAGRFLSIFPTLQTPLAREALHLQAQDSPPARPEIVGGSPLSLCHESGPGDLFALHSVVLSKQPVHM